MLTTTFRIVVAVLALGVCAVPLACGGRFLGNNDRASTVDVTGEGSIDDGSLPALDATSESTAPDTSDGDALGPVDVDAGLVEACASLGDSNADGGEAGSCYESIDAACTGGGCLGASSDWSTALQYWCGRAAAYPQCDGFHLLVVRGRDTIFFYYYDLCSSKLVRIEGEGPSGIRECVAGQPGSEHISSNGVPDCSDGTSGDILCASEASGD